MKRIKTFEGLTNQPRYLKDKFILFPKPGISKGFSNEILKKYGITEIEGYMDDALLVKSTLDIVESILGDYPEFFESYSRVDINLEEAWSGCERVIGQLEDLRDSLGSLDKWGKSKMPKNWNLDIDKIIQSLNGLKTN
jgi:hypothetical protein